MGHWARIMEEKRTCMNLNCMNLKYECKLEVLEGRGWAQMFKLINTPLEGAGGCIDFIEKWMMNFLDSQPYASNRHFELMNKRLPKCVNLSLSLILECIPCKIIILFYLKEHLHVFWYLYKFSWLLLPIWIKLIEKYTVMPSFSSTLFLFTTLGLTIYQCSFNKSDNKQEPVNI